MGTTLDRRSFIRTAALAGSAAMVAASGALAAEPKPSASADAAPAGAPGADDAAGMSSDLMATLGTGSMTNDDDLDYAPAPGSYPVGVPEGTPEGLDWMAIPEPITDVAKEMEADVVVVGAGIAGCAAARAACEAGASVIVLEATDKIQGRGMDLGVFNATVEKEAGLEADDEFLNQVCLDMAQYCGNRAKQSLMRTWIRRCGEDFDWFYEELLKPAGWGCSIARWPLEEPYSPHDGEWFPQYIASCEVSVPEGADVDPFAGFGAAVEVLGEKAEELGAQFVFNTRARQLVRGDDNATGRVSAVIAEAADGTYVKVSAKKGVILATGDYGHNDDLMRVWCPSQAWLASSRNVYGSNANQGDGHLMGMWVGGMMQQIPHPYMAHSNAGLIGNFPSLYVDINGDRFTNEDIPGQTFADVADQLPQRCWWQLADADYPNQLKFSSPGHGAVMSYDGDIDAWNDAIATGDKDTIEAMLAEQGNTIDHAWSIEELADAIHVDADRLKATVDRYNELCEKGFDEDFGKMAKRLFPLKTPPFFYSTNAWNFLVVVGGLDTDTKSEVLDCWGNPIPGLYACGNVQGGRFAIDYPTIIPGISHSIALTYGRIAGTEAAGADPSVTEVASLWKQHLEDERASKASAVADQAASATYKDGSYEAASKGMGGDVPVTVTVKGGKIASVEVGDNSETDGIGTKAIEQLPAKIVEAGGTTGVDAVSGASVTSGAIISAVNDCLAQAK